MAARPESVCRSSMPEGVVRSEGREGRGRSSRMVKGMGFGRWRVRRAARVRDAGPAPVIAMRGRGGVAEAMVLVMI